MIRVVIDANFMGGGRLKRATLDRLLDLQTPETAVLVVVPEVVVWEWAEHAHYDLLKAQGQLAPASRLHGYLGVLPPPFEVPGPVELAARVAATLTETLGDAVEVDVHDPMDGLDAVRFQVLQLEGCERKGKDDVWVKTGAPDRLVFSTVRRQIADRPASDSVILGSGDGLLRDTCAARWPNDLTLAKGWNELAELVLQAQDNVDRSIERRVEAVVRAALEERTTQWSDFQSLVDEASSYGRDEVVKLRPWAPDIDAADDLARC